jgi:hypothetical protein
MFLAERAQLGRKIGRDFLIGNGFWHDVGERVRRLNLPEDLEQVRKLLFLGCCETVRSLCEQCESR